MEEERINESVNEGLTETDNRMRFFHYAFSLFICRKWGPNHQKFFLAHSQKEVARHTSYSILFSACTNIIDFHEILYWGILLTSD
jgi:hypothetical protein